MKPWTCTKCGLERRGPANEYMFCDVSGLCMPNVVTGHAAWDAQTRVDLVVAGVFFALGVLAAWLVGVLR